MVNDALLLPRLRHTRWIGWTQVMGRDLMEQPMVCGLPRLGVGEDNERKFSFLSPSVLQADGRGFAKLEELALANLVKRPAKWEVSEKRGGFLGFGGKPSRLTYIDEFACERMLDAAFLKEAHKVLEAEMLAIGIPVRGILTVQRAATDMKDLPEFVHFIEQAFARVAANLEPVTPVVFTAQAGRLVGVIAPQPPPPEVLPVRGFPWPTREVVVVAPDASASAPEPTPADRPRRPAPTSPPNDGVLQPGDLDDNDNQDAMVRLIGYVPTTRSIEFSCVLDPGERIPNRELARVRRLASSRQLPDGRRIAFTRIVFIDRVMAERAREQLVTTGAILAFYDERGELLTLP